MGTPTEGATSTPVKQAIWFCVFIFTDVGKVLAFSWAIRGTAVQCQSIIITNSSVSIIIGALLSSRGGADALRQCVDISAIKKFFFVAMLFSFNQTLGALQYVSLSPGTAKVLAQVRLPILAAGSYFVVAKVYTGRQWVGLLMITASAIAFCVSKAGVTHASGQTFGYICSVTASLCTVFAGLFSQKFLQAAKSTPFYTQKVQLELGGIVIAVAMLFFMPWFADTVGLDNKDELNPFNPRKEYLCDGFKTTVWGVGKPTPAGCALFADYEGNFYDGWSVSTCCCLCMLMAQSWMAGYIAKAMSQVMKQVGQCMSLLLCYFLGDCLLFSHGGGISPTLTAIAFLVVGSMGFFLTSPSHKADPSASPRSSKLASLGLNSPLLASGTAFWSWSRGGAPSPAAPFVVSDRVSVVQV